MNNTLDKLKRIRRKLLIIQYVLIFLGLIFWFIASEIRDLQIKNIEDRVTKLEKQLNP